MIFGKFKTKLSLVDDYIYICRVKSYYLRARDFCDDNLQGLFDSIVRYCEQLKKQYYQVFLRLKMLDISFEMLNIGLENTKGVIVDESKTNDIEKLQKYQQNLQILKKMQQNLPKNLKKLAFNDYEIKFIVQSA